MQKKALVEQNLVTSQNFLIEYIYSDYIEILHDRNQAHPAHTRVNSNFGHQIPCHRFTLLTFITLTIIYQGLVKTLL